MTMQLPLGLTVDAEPEEAVQKRRKKRWLQPVVTVMAAILAVALISIYTVASSLL